MAPKKSQVSVNPARQHPASDPYGDVLTGVIGLLEAARHTAVRAVNVVMTATYWEIGRRIVEYEQDGPGRADYGEKILERLSADLGERFGRGFSLTNLKQFRKFFMSFPHVPIGQTTSDQFTVADRIDFEQTVGRFPLPWSHYVKLLKVEKPEARGFYESEALRGGWTVKQLDRQIATLFYERALASRNKAAMLRKGSEVRAGDLITPEEVIKDPLVLEFLGLKDEYSESDLEEALVKLLESFLLELGGDFTFIGRQKRLRVGDEWYWIELLFNHRRLRRVVVIDFKLGKFTHADAGQMHLDLNYAREHWTHADENPPVGVILCTEKDHAVVHYALDGLPNKILAAEYLTKLPGEAALVAELERTRRKLEARRPNLEGRNGI